MIQEIINKAELDNENPEAIVHRVSKNPIDKNLINSAFTDYYDNLGIVTNRRLIEDFVKFQSNYNHSNYTKSYPCIYTLLTTDTIQPGMLGQLDANWYDFVETIYNDCVKDMPQFSNEFSKVFTFMGALPDVLDVIPPSAVISRVENGLDAEPEREFLEFLQQYTAFLFSELYYIPEGFVFKVSSKGNPGIPHCIKHKDALIFKDTSPFKDMSFKMFKKAQVINFNEYLKSNEFHDCFSGFDFYNLFTKYGILFFYTDQHRSQPDKSTKQRFVRLEKLWNRDFYTKHQISDGIKMINKNFSIEKFFSRADFIGRTFADGLKVQCKKWRFVFAESASTNQPVNICLSAFRKNLGRHFGFTFKCSDSITVNRSFDNFIKDNKINLRDYDLLTYDVSNFDYNLSQSINIAYVKGIQKISETLASWILLNSNAPGACSIPYAKPDPRTIRNNLFFSGNPFKISTFNMGVSPSGVADVSERAKIINSAFVLYNFLKKFDANKVTDILKGHNKDFCFMNLGDNNTILIKKNFRFKDKLTNSKIFKVDFDDNNTFGGLNIELDIARNKIVSFDSPVSTLIKVLTPERPLDDEMRSSYALGTINRYEIANTNPKTAVVLDSIDRQMFNRYRNPSQLELSKKRIYDKDFNKSLLYEQLQKYLGATDVKSVSSFFISILESGGDKLFYTDVYENLSDGEKKICDDLFFTVMKDEEICNILDYFNLRSA